MLQMHKWESLPPTNMQTVGDSQEVRPPNNNVQHMVVAQMQQQNTTPSHTLEYHSTHKQDRRKLSNDGGIQQFVKTEPHEDNYGYGSPAEASTSYGEASLPTRGAASPPPDTFHPFHQSCLESNNSLINERIISVTSADQSESGVVYKTSTMPHTAMVGSAEDNEKAILVGFVSFYNLLCLLMINLDKHRLQCT